MLLARRDHAAVVLDGKIYVIGGTADSSGTALANVEVYDPGPGPKSQIQICPPVCGGG
jgi:hypothetical protein